MTVRYGLIGCGFVGSAMAGMLQTIDGTTLSAVCSGSGDSASKLAAELGCARATNLVGLIGRTDVDAVLVATPNSLHREPVIMAAAAGKPVFCEKPLATSVADARAMVSACEAAQVPLMVGHMMHFYPGLLALKQLIDAGDIGRPLAAHVERTGWEPRRDHVSWKKIQALSGGHLFHHIHEIDLLTWLLGPVARVYAVGGNLAHRGPGYGDEDDVLLLTLTFANGTFGTMQYGSGFRWPEHLVKINGSKGAAFLDNKLSSIVVSNDNLGRRDIKLFASPEENLSMIDLHATVPAGVVYGAPGQPMRAYLHNAIRAELEHFTNVVAGEASITERNELFGGAMALHAVEVASAALASKECGEPVHI